MADKVTPLPAVGNSLDQVAPAPTSTKKSDAAANAGSRWAEPAGRLRNTTRWVLAVFGTVGLAFLAVAPLTGAQKIAGVTPTAGATLAAAGAVLLGVILALRAGAEVFISRAGSLTDLDTWFAHEVPGRPRYEIFGGLVDTPEELVEEWQRASDDRWIRAWRSACSTTADGKGSSEAMDKSLASIAQTYFDEVDSISTNAMQFAAYRELVKVYRWAQVWIFAAALLVAGGVFTFFVLVPSGDTGSTTSTAPRVVAPTVAPAPVDLCLPTQNAPVVRESPGLNEVYVLTANGCQRFEFRAPAAPAPAAARPGAGDGPFFAIISLSAVIGLLLYWLQGRGLSKHRDTALEG